MNLNNYVKIKSHVEWKQVDKEIIIFDTKNTSFYKPNETGALIWWSLVKGNNLLAALKSVQNSCEADSAELQKDVIDFLNELVAKDLVQPIAKKPSSVKEQINLS